MSHPQEPVNTEAHFPAIGRWLITAIPSAWIFVEGFGIRQIDAGAGGGHVNVALGMDSLGPATDLQKYIAAQVRLINAHLKSPVIAGPQKMAFPGADQAALLFVRHVAQNGVTTIHAQTYVLVETWVGIVTLTTPEADLHSIRPDYDFFTKGLRIIAA